MTRQSLQLARGHWRRARGVRWGAVLKRRYDTLEVCRYAHRNEKTGHAYHCGHCNGYHWSTS